MKEFYTASSLSAGLIAIVSSFNFEVGVKIDCFWKRFSSESFASLKDSASRNLRVSIFMLDLSSTLLRLGVSEKIQVAQKVISLIFWYLDNVLL